MDKKNLLVIGGSYFIGRVFCMYAAKTDKYNITVINRGTYKLNIPGITEHHCSRNDIPAMKEFLQNKEFDFAVDFCSLKEGDSQSFLELAKGKLNHYVYISSCSILDDSQTSRNEDFPYINSSTAMEYIRNKLSNEKETISYCESNSITYTVLRPCFVYGPFNYAPRESYYFEHIFKGKAFPHPTDCNTKFSFVYVVDIAKAIDAVLSGTNSHNEIFNLAGPEQLTYSEYKNVLREISEEDIKYYDITVEQAERENIPIPFPLNKNELFDGSKITTLLDFKYTPFTEGMQKTYNAFKPIYKR